MNAYIMPGIVPQLHPAEIAITQAFGIEYKKLYHRTRKREIVDARHAIIYYRHKILKQKPAHIEKTTPFDHATVLYASKKVKNLLQTNREFRTKYEHFLELLK